MGPHCLSAIPYSPGSLAEIWTERRGVTGATGAPRHILCWEMCLKVVLALSPRREITGEVFTSDSSPGVHVWKAA